MKNIFNRQFNKFLPLYLVMVSLIVLIGSSYALLRSSQTGTHTYVMNVANLEVTFLDSETDTLTFTNMYPMSDEEGIAYHEDDENELIFTVKNTGNVKAIYNVYIEETSTSPVMKTVIRYIDKKGTNNYSSPKLLSNDNYIDRLAELEVGATATYRVKAWLAEEATSTYMNKTFTARIVVEALQDMGSSLLNAIYNPKQGCQTYVEEDGITYISGSKECIDFNYVWWSGKMWRITAIYPDGAMKMVTDNMITSISFNESSNVYYNKETQAKSYMFQWLNEDFLDTLYNNGSDVIDTTKSWNATMPANTTISTKPIEEDATMIPTTISPVGLLNSYENYMSYKNTTAANGYLNIVYNWWLLNPYNASYVWCVGLGGDGSDNSPTYAYGSRPSIYLKSGISLSGNGTKESPYRLPYDYNEANTDDKIYTRHSGEYVKLSNNGTEQVFRIVGVEDNKTKIVAMDYADNNATRKFATSTGSANTLWGSGTTTGTDTWYTYLNGTYYPGLVSTYGELFDSATYYLGTSGYNYKLSVCANTTSGNTKVCDKTTQTGTFNIGLPRYGEMFATQQGSGYSSSINMWLMNRYDSSSVWSVGNSGNGSNHIPSTAYGSRPSIHLKSTVKILSGAGTELDPYVVGL